jgi:hypothetical protein
MTSVTDKASITLELVNKPEEGTATPAAKPGTQMGAMGHTDLSCYTWQRPTLSRVYITVLRKTCSAIRLLTASWTAKLFQKPSRQKNLVCICVDDPYGMFRGEKLNNELIN